MKQPRIALPDQGQIAGAQSVSRALGLLPLLGRNPVHGMGIGEIVEETGLSRPTARRLLLSLMYSGMVDQDPQTKCYMLGEEIYLLGSLAAQRFGLLDVAHDSVQRLAEATGDTAFLSVRRDVFALCVHKEEGDFPIRVQALQVGYRHPLGVGAGSLSILAALDDDEVEEILEQNARLLAEDYPRASVPALRDAVAQTRERGWALNPGMVLANSWAIGRAIRMPDGHAVGALSVAAIDSRMSPDRQHEIAARIAEAVEQVESRLARRHGAGHGSNIRPRDSAQAPKSGSRPRHSA
ncbi:IclR family transcriptional regulator [Salipiger pallidus]|uniref:IclR family transcriptional regulator n=1 Tax=Salipiger pallidus TaxID=1775170 RepID=A0A8J2ZKI4_9RHOB|nr:IclR family transcriptional regulator [Salipiger pallidus]GGG74002.1 IclR family transcriptional regulator [Salipiger pallidus]